MIYDLVLLFQFIGREPHFKQVVFLSELYLDELILLLQLFDLGLLVFIAFNGLGQ